MFIIDSFAYLYERNSTVFVFSLMGSGLLTIVYIMFQERGTIKNRYQNMYEDKMETLREQLKESNKKIEEKNLKIMELDKEVSRLHQAALNKSLDDLVRKVETLGQQRDLNLPQHTKQYLKGDSND